MHFQPWKSPDIANRVKSGIEAAVAFNLSLPPGIHPDAVRARNPPIGAREWLTTDEGKRLRALEELALQPAYHNGKAFPLSEELESAAIIQMASKYLSIDDRHKLRNGSRRRKLADQIVHGGIRFEVWGNSAFGVHARVYFELIPWLYAKPMGLPLTFSGVELVHIKSRQSLGRVIGSGPLFRKLSELSPNKHEKPLTSVMGRKVQNNC